MKKKQAAIALALLTASSAFCLRLAKQAGKRLEEALKKRK